MINTFQNAKTILRRIPKFSLKIYGEVWPYYRRGNQCCLFRGFNSEVPNQNSESEIHTRNLNSFALFNVSFINLLLFNCLFKLLFGISFKKKIAKWDFGMDN